MEKKYIGARYVPIVRGAWDSAEDYEPLEVVLYNDCSYTSKTFVPVGVVPTNETYWVLTANYNARVEMINNDINSKIADSNKRIDNIVSSASDYYVGCSSTDSGALLVVNSGAIAGQINLASVTPKLDTFVPAVGNYVRLVSNGLTSELVDMRLDNGGTIHKSAGEAVRSQLTQTAKKLTLLDIYAKITSNSQIDTIEYENQLVSDIFPYNASASSMISIPVHVDIVLENNTNYGCVLYFTDGTYMNANNTFRIMDKDGNVLKTGALNSTYNLPNMSIARTIEIWLNPTGCQAYASKTIDYINFYKSVDGNNYTSFNLEYKGVKIEQVDWMQNKYINTKNTFNKDVALKGYQMPGSGIISVNADYFVSDYMPVLPSDVIYGVGGQTISSVVLYDANKARITAVQPNFASVGYVSRITLSSYANIAYIRISDLMANINTLCIAKSPIYKYEPYNALDLSVVSKVNNAMLNFWEGKNGDSLGDSITGQNYFQKYTKQYFNLAKFSNHGIGGTTLSGNANANGDSMWMDSRINALDVDADFITVLGGQNDGVVAIGSLTLENYDTNTYAGALNVLISKLLYKYAKNVGYYTNVNYSSVAQITTAKDVIIILCTPFYVPSESEPYRLKNMANAVREIAKLWGLNVCDLSNKSGLNYGVSNIYWSTDRTHPLEAGHRDRITPVLIGVMEQIKPIDFTKCSYI